MFLIFRYIAIPIDKWKQAVLFEESYQYIDMPHINDSPTNYKPLYSSVNKCLVQELYDLCV